MELIIGIISVLLVLGFLEVLVNKLKNLSSSINWGRFLAVLIIGSALLAVIFSFTAEGVLVIVGFYIALIVISLFYGLFKNKESNHNCNNADKNVGSHQQGAEQSRVEIAENLLDILDDETIAKKTRLSVDEVKLLRLKS